MLIANHVSVSFSYLISQCLLVATKLGGFPLMPFNMIFLLIKKKEVFISKFSGIGVKVAVTFAGKFGYRMTTNIVDLEYFCSLSAALP